MAGRVAGTEHRLTRRQLLGVGVAIPFVVSFTGCKPTPPAPPIRKETQPAALGKPTDLVELTKLDPSIRLDLRYATPDNFTGRVLYKQARAFLARPAAAALVRARQRAVRDGFGLTIFDAYRPWRVTKQLWDTTPPGPKRNYVANPKKGSKHNRGCAVDLTMHDLATGALVEMPSGYDEFSERAHRDYRGGPAAATANSQKLQSYMEAEGFRGISNEWWHFDFDGWEQFPIRDVPFEDMP
jgi:D-alanyl-D-alanine dipeptidase